MKNTQAEEPGKNVINSAHRSLTPRELVQYHMEHPDEPITDEDMKNLNLELDSDMPEDEIALTPEQKQSADKLADAVQSDGTSMSYKADI